MLHPKNHQAIFSHKSHTGSSIRLQIETFLSYHMNTSSSIRNTRALHLRERIKLMNMCIMTLISTQHTTCHLIRILTVWSQTPNCCHMLVSLQFTWRKPNTTRMLRCNHHTSRGHLKRLVSVTSQDRYSTESTGQPWRIMTLLSTFSRPHRPNKLSIDTHTYIP